MAEKPNLILPVPPALVSILAPHAQKAIKKLVKIKNFQGQTENVVSCLQEIKWLGGPQNENLEVAEVEVGWIGMVVGIATQPTVLRVLIQEKIYHISILNLEIME